MVDEVIARERVDELALAAPVRDRDGDELAIAGRHRDAPGAGEESVRLGREQRRRDEDPGSSLVRDASTIAAIEASSPTTSPRSRF